MAYIMLLEDDKLLGNAYEKLLQSEGYEVTHINNGLGGLEAIVHTRAPDLVITDILMPGFDGEDMIAALDEFGEPRPIIVVTAMDDEERIARIRSQPMVKAILAKPLLPERLLETVTRVLNGDDLSED